ncbi:MAG: hypothetical protein E7003_06870 [Eggerthellaceae bacterium]|nr:hypothetical protein [Eggerthellaceae bacterium]
MAKRVGPSEMIELHTEEAEELINETRYGLGTPIEARIANAIRENAANIAAQNKGMSKYIQKMSETQKDIKDAALSVSYAEEVIENYCKKAEVISKNIGAEVYGAKAMADDISKQVVDAIEITVRKAVESNVQRSVEKANCASSERLNDASEKFDKAIDLNKDRMERVSAKISDTLEAAKMNTFGPVMRIVLIVVLALSVVTSVASCSIIKPIITGEARIVLVE